MDSEVLAGDDGHVGGGHYDGSNLNDYHGHQHESQMDNDDGGGMDMDDPVHDDGWTYGDASDPYNSGIHDHDEDGFLGEEDPASTTNHFHERHSYFYDFNDDSKNSWYDVGYHMLRSFRRRLFPWYDDDFRNNINSSAGIWIAVFVVLAFQFWPQMQDIIFRVQTVGWYQTVEDMFVQAGNMIRAQIQLTIEFGRTIQLYMMKWTNTRAIFSGVGTGRGRGTNVSNNNNRDRRHLSPSSEVRGEGTTSNSLLDGIWGRGGPSSATNFGSGFFFSPFDEQRDSPPPLVTLVTTPNGKKEWKVLDDDNDGDSKNEIGNGRDGSANERKIASSSSAPEKVGRTDFELEPAFSEEKDYPPGWLLYHTVLGVVAKEEADKYDNQTQKDRKFSEQQAQGGSQGKAIVAEGKYVVDNSSIEVQNYNKSCGSNGLFDHTNNKIQDPQKQESESTNSVEIYDSTHESNARKDDTDRKNNGSHDSLNIGASISSIPVAATGI